MVPPLSRLFIFCYELINILFSVAVQNNTVLGEIFSKKGIFTDYSWSYYRIVYSVRTLLFHSVIIIFILGGYGYVQIQKMVRSRRFFSTLLKNTFKNLFFPTFSCIHPMSFRNIFFSFCLVDMSAWLAEWLLAQTNNPAVQGSSPYRRIFFSDTTTLKKKPWGPPNTTTLKKNPRAHPIPQH